MGKPSKPITFTLSGTSANDLIGIQSGHIYLNGAERTVVPGAVKITINGGAGDDTVATDSPHAFGGTSIFYDGGRGVDTLDFTNSTEAVAVRMYQPIHGSWQQTIITDFTLDPIGAGAPDWYDPADPQKILTFQDTTVETNNVQNFENVIEEAFFVIYHFSHLIIQVAA